MGLVRTMRYARLLAVAVLAVLMIAFMFQPVAAVSGTLDPADSDKWLRLYLGGSAQPLSFMGGSDFHCRFDWVLDGSGPRHRRKCMLLVPLYVGSCDC